MGDPSTTAISFKDQITIIIGAIGAIIALWQLVRSANYFKHGNMIKKAELITLLNDKLRPFVRIRKAIKKYQDAEKVEKQDIIDRYIYDARDYAVIFESMWPFIQSSVLTEEEFDRYFGKRFEEFYNSEIMKEFIDRSEFSDMRTNLSHLENVRRKVSSRVTSSEQIRSGMWRYIITKYFIN